MANEKDNARPGKYHPDLLIKMFRKAAALRNEMLEAGFTDNGGAIHCADAFGHTRPKAQLSRPESPHWSEAPRER